MKGIQKNIVFVLFLIVWIYLWIRAVSVPLSHDEVATFFHFIHNGDFIPYKGALWDANNHLLNSFLTYVSYKMFGHSELALRLPSLIIAPLYFYYNYKITKKLKSTTLKWVFIISMFFTHYLVEHLAYTRGYGMSLAFLAGAIYYTIGYRKHVTSKYLYKACGMLLLAISANLSLLHSFNIIIGYLVLISIFHLKGMGIKSIIKQFTIYVFTSVGFLLAFVYALDLKKSGALYMGGQEGFWDISVISLIKSINFYYNTLITLLVLLLVGIAVFSFLSNKKLLLIKGWLSANNLFMYLFVGNIAAIILSNNLLGVNYPENRTVMFLIVFLIGAVCFNINYLANSKLKKIFVYSSFLLLFIPIRSLGFINFRYQTYIDFIKQRIPPRYINTIIDDSKKHKYQPLIAGYHMRHFVYAYYNFKNGGQLNHFYEFDYPGNIADWQIVDTSESAIFRKYYNVVDHDEISSYSLLKRKTTTKTKHLFTNSFNGTAKKVNQEFFEFCRLNNIADTLKNKAIKLTFNFNIKTYANPTKARLIINIADKKGNRLHYDFFPLDWTKTTWNQKFTYNMYVHNIPKNAESIVVYLWNLNKKEFEVSDGTIKFEEILTH